MKAFKRFDPFSDMEIEEYLCGDLSAEIRAQIEHAMHESVELSDYITKRQAQKEEFYSLHPRLVLPSKAEKSFFLRPMVLAGAGAVAIILALILVFPVLENRSLEVESTIRAMGSLKANLAIRRDDRVFTHRPGVLLRPGDQVRLSIESPQSGYLTLISRIGNQYDVYYNSLKAPAGTYTVPDSLILDDDLDQEEWFIILSPKKAAAQKLIQLLRQNKQLKGAATSIRITKEAAP
jgi:hypothetical protein